MDATTMVPTSSLASSLSAAYPQFSFESSDDAYWSAADQTIYFVASKRPHDTYDLLHETGHALLGHSSYQKDIELITYEREAWAVACRISADMSLSIPDEYIQTALDSYRDWLHVRSICPTCQQTGLQDSESYHCLICKSRWRPNEAKQCGLKRYTIKKTPK